MDGVFKCKDICLPGSWWISSNQQYKLSYLATSYHTVISLSVSEHHK